MRYRVVDQAGILPATMKAVYQNPLEGPYADPSLIQSGDWLMFRNLVGAEIDHSAIFITWLDFDRKIGLVIDYVGQDRKELCRFDEFDLAEVYGSPKCIVKLGCWGPVVNCNVTKRGWMDGIGGCPNVGGICIGCTMPGFPDKFMPFMNPPPGAMVSSAVSGVTGGIIKALREITQRSANKEPDWRHPRGELTTGYQPKHYANA